MIESIDSVAIPTMLRGLTLLDGYLVPAQEFCERRAISEWSLLDANLAPDMFTLVRQVQAATDNATCGIARLAAVEAPVFTDTEIDFDALRGRVARAFEFIESLPQENFAQAGTRLIDQRYRGVDQPLPGSAYLLGVLLPNFYFHVFMAYGILLRSGVPLPPPPSRKAMDAVQARFEVIHTGGS